MKMTWLRAACVLVEARGVQILMDPWLTDGEYYGSWAHYPPYKWEHDLSGIDYIYVSHIHPDHYSAETMKRLPKVPVLIHSYQMPFLRKNIEALGFEVRELPHNVPVDLGGVSINILAADDCDSAVCGKFFGCSKPSIRSAQIDTMCVIDDGDKVLVNVNDCPYELAEPMLARLSRQYPNVDLLMAVYAGAGPYPQCFEMPISAKKEKAAVKEEHFLNQPLKFARALNAKMLFPFAGDYVLCGSLAHLNQFRGVPDVERVHEMASHISAPTLRLEHGASWEIGSPSPATHPVDQEAKAKYVSEVLSKRKLDYEDDVMPSAAELASLLDGAVVRMTEKRKEMGFESSTPVFIDLGEALYLVPMSDNRANTEKFVKIGADKRLLKRILTRKAHWNTAEIGSHLTFDRRPDYFERGLHHMVSFLHA